MSISNLSRRQKSALMIITDIILVQLSLWLAFSLRLGVWFWPNPHQTWLFISAPIIALPVFFKFGLYRMVVRYIGQEGMLGIIKSSSVFILAWLLIAITTLPVPFGSELGFPRSIPIILWMTLILTIGGSRQLSRWLLLSTSKNPQSRNALIYGANRLGSELASSLSHDKNVHILGIIDDDPALKGHYVENLKVLGDRTHIAKIRATINPLEVLLTISPKPSEQRKELFKYLEDKNVTVKTIPSLREFTTNITTIDDLRNIDITDLLTRKEVEPNYDLLTACVTGKKILVTGAGGSIGSELCRQILELKPTSLVLFEHSEHALYLINQELLNQYKRIDYKIKIIPILGSITNKQRVEETIKKFEINTIYHAAAYKHVTLIENNIGEGILNNIFGTYHVAQTALDMNVESFILISTDKAVRPTSAMGATKRICELIIQGLSQKQDTISTSTRKPTSFVIVRFGNVLGSSGSVIPLFQKQIASGGPITITHPEVTRYFMTISEASQLVMQAGSMGAYCSIFTLNMGDPISILSLAKQLAYLSGYMLKTGENKTEDSAIEIQYTGLQKGEKIHEELYLGENITSTEHSMIMKAQEAFSDWPQVEKMLTKLKTPHNHSDQELRGLLIQYATNKDSDKSVLL